MLAASMVSAQSNFVRTKEGRNMLNKNQLIANCLRNLKKNRTDAMAVSVCECQTQTLDRQFTNKQFAKHTKSGLIDLDGLMKEDSLVEKRFQECYTNSGQTLLFQAEGFESQFISNCISAIKDNTEKKLDINNLTSFCKCQLQMVKAKKISDKEMETLSDPNSLLFFEMVSKCGDPFLEKNEIVDNWTSTMVADVRGPNTDTVKVLALNGMTFVKLKLGSLVKVWLFDTGASDLLINNEMEETLKQENILSSANYLGIGQYEMANGMIDTCRRYRVDNIQIGSYMLNNIVVAVTDKGKRIIVGKSLLNKFSQWELNNRNNDLILTK